MTSAKLGFAYTQTMGAVQVNQSGDTSQIRILLTVVLELLLSLSILNKTFKRIASESDCSHSTTAEPHSSFSTKSVMDAQNSCRDNKFLHFGFRLKVGWSFK